MGPCSYYLDGTYPALETDYAPTNASPCDYIHRRDPRCGIHLGFVARRTDENRRTRKQVESPGGREARARSCAAGRGTASRFCATTASRATCSALATGSFRTFRRVPHPEFRYTFEVVNVSDINAFALPGGPMYVNRGMIEAAKNEGEVAGVLAHEISHVALRHGTAQAGKATPYQVGSILGQIAGAIIGGVAGQAISIGSQVIPGTIFLKYGREYERQSDLLGAQIMARAGYDPRDMASMFQTIQAKGGGGGPEWMSSHPNPANRQQAITQEAAGLRVSNPVRNTPEFTNAKARLQRMAPAPTTEQAMKQGGGGRPTSRDRLPGGQVGRVEPPSGRYQTYDGGNLFRIAVPSNWRELQGGNNSVTFAPEGGYGDYRGQSVFTHGLQVGRKRLRTRAIYARRLIN